ncbi:hypothetical protein [Microbacterium murale]|uniref:ABC-2 type transport system permease protein n=1 Tax=Microbacterium murale TaxID=1081040 RepID=A0ABU0P6S2_9MICO|nr:hypothetical protein [Microbacterium murale]MDQ0643030.1 hypothetical protein [Microbacterium murale]
MAETRAVHRARNAHRTRGDTAYVVYVSVLVAAIAGVPIVRAIVLALATPAAMSTLSEAGTERIVAVLGALIWAGALAGGRARGPVVPPPFVAATLSRSDISPRVAWARDFFGSAVGMVLVLGAISALAVSGFLAHAAAVGASVSFIIGTVLFAVSTTAIWLAGQVLGRRGAVILGSALVLLLVAAVAIPLDPPLLPASALADLWPSTPGATGTALVVLATTAVAALWAFVVLLDRMLPTTVEEHAQRWEAMTVLATTGDISGALDRTRARPTVGRRVRIPFSQPLILAVLQRAAIGAARTPLRAVVALIALATAGVGWAWFAELQAGPRWVPAVGAGLLTFAAIGAFSDGFREAADMAGRPAVYGRTAWGMLLLNLPLPLLAGVMVPTAAAIVAGGGVETAAIVATIGVALVAVRAYDATKGPMPIELMMPVPTPAGDASAIGMWAWQADALLWTGVVAFWLSTSSTAGPATLLWALPIAGLLAALTAGRLRRAAS